MWSIILLSAIFVSSSAQNTDNITRKTQVLQEYKNEYRSIIDNIASYIADTMYDKCKNTSASLKEKEDTCDNICIKTIRECLQSAGNMSVDDLPHDIKSEVARLMLFKVVYIVGSKLDDDTDNNETVTDAEAFMDSAARGIDEDIRNSINTALARKRFLGDWDNRKIRPRFSFFSAFTVTYRISKFVYKVGFPILKRLLKGGVKQAKKRLSKENVVDTLKDYSQLKITKFVTTEEKEGEKKEIDIDISEELQTLLLEILADLAGVGILFDLLNLSRSLIFT